MTKIEDGLKCGRGGRSSDSRYRAASQSAADIWAALTQGGARGLACPGLLSAALTGEWPLHKAEVSEA